MNSVHGFLGRRAGYLPAGELLQALLPILHFNTLSVSHLTGLFLIQIEENIKTMLQETSFLV